MKKTNYYIKGFTLIEMAISLIIASIGTGTMMYVFNAAQTRYFNDQMEVEIETYCNKATDFIATIVSLSDSTITASSTTPPRYTIWKFNDKYINQDSYDRIDRQRKITIEMTDKGGVVIKERNRDITGELYNKYMLKNHKKDNSGHYEAPNREWNALALQGFNPGNKSQDGDQNLPTQYIFHGFRIKAMAPDDSDIHFFHNIANKRIKNPLEECTYDIEIDVQIQTKFDKNSTSDQFYTYKKYSRRAYCPSCFVRQKANSDNNAKNI